MNRERRVFLVSLIVLVGHGAECKGFVWIVVRRRKLAGNAGWRGGHAFHLESAVCASGKTCSRD